MLKTATNHTIINMITLCFSRMERRPSTCGGNYKSVIRTSSVLVLAGSLLCGCAAMRENNARIDDRTCQSYGARPGTDMYVKCRMQLRAEMYGTGGGGGGGMDPATRAVLLNSAMSGGTSCTSMPGLGGSVLTDCQ